MPTYLIMETVNSSVAGNSATPIPLSSIAERNFFKTAAMLSSGRRMTSGARNFRLGTESETVTGTVEGEGR